MRKPEFAQRLGNEFFEQDILGLAQALLGVTIHSTLKNTKLAGIIVEVEAYMSANDAASHSARGMTKSNSSMFADPGTLYVYPIHSRHCLNVVCEPAGQGAAVLVRGIEPIIGIEQMVRNRGLAKMDSRSLKTRRLLGQGPGRLCESLGIDRRHDGLNLVTDPKIGLYRSLNLRDWESRTSIRIGISKAKELQYRFFIDGNHFVSGLAGDHRRGRCWSFTDGIA